MAVETIYCFPTDIESGCAYVVNLGSDTRFPTSAWSAVLSISQNGQNRCNVTATETNGAYIFTLTNAITGSIPPGPAQIAVYVTETSSGQRALWLEGVANVSPYLGANQTQTPAQVALAAIETALATLSADPYASVSFNGQSYTTKNHAELQSAWTFWKAAVIREQAARNGQRGKSPFSQQVRFR